MDINGKSSLENGTVDASVVRKTNVIITDEFSMIDCTVFIIIEQLCRTFSSKMVDKSHGVVAMFYFLVIQLSYHLCLILILILKYCSVVIVLCN